jgi:hypothetical protein
MKRIGRPRAPHAPSTTPRERPNENAPTAPSLGRADTNSQMTSRVPSAQKLSEQRRVDRNASAGAISHRRHVGDFDQISVTADKCERPRNAWVDTDEVRRRA